MKLLLQFSILISPLGFKETVIYLSSPLLNYVPVLFKILGDSPHRK